MNYRLDIYDQPGHLCGVRCYTAPNGQSACQAAIRILAADRRADHADLHVDDGTGQHLFYTQVNAS